MLLLRPWANSLNNVLGEGSLNTELVVIGAFKFYIGIPLVRISLQICHCYIYITDNSSMAHKIGKLFHYSIPNNNMQTETVHVIVYLLIAVDAHRMLVHRL